MIYKERRCDIVGQTKAQLLATKKYQSQFEMIRVRMTPAEKKAVQDHAAACGQSVNTFAKRAIFETIIREAEKENVDDHC